MRILKRVLIVIAVLIVLYWVGSIVYAYLPGDEHPAKSFATNDDIFVDVDGVTIRYRKYVSEPHPDKSAIVLVHGFAGSLYTFRHLAPILAEAFDVYTVDMPGFGLSDKPVDYDYNMGAQGKTLVRFLEVLGLEKVAAGGHSMGGPIVMHAAIASPIVKQMIFLDAGILDTGVPTFAKYMFFPFNRFAAKMFAGRGFRKKFLLNSFYDKSLVTDEAVDEYLKMTMTDDYMDGWTSMMRNYDPISEFQFVNQVKVPSLLIWGEHDIKNPPSNGKKIQAAIPGSKLVIVKGSGHYVQEEKPEIVAQAITAFLGDK
jgi:pimeloyl-ACP methyl ester carboxylesterase